MQSVSLRFLPSNRARRSSRSCSPIRVWGERRHLAYASETTPRRSPSMRSVNPSLPRERIVRGHSSREGSRSISVTCWVIATSRWPSKARPEAASIRSAASSAMSIWRIAGTGAPPFSRFRISPEASRRVSWPHQTIPCISSESSASHKPTARSWGSLPMRSAARNYSISP